MACPHCGFDNPEGSLRCARCQSLLDTAEISRIYPGRSQIPPSRRIRKAYWQARKYRVQRRIQPFQKSGVLPAVFSFFVPGLGQFITGERRKGTLIFFACLILIILGWPLRGGLFINLLFGILLSIHGYSVLAPLRHHPLTAKAGKRFLISILIAVGLFIYYLLVEEAISSSRHFRIVRINSETFQPVLQRNAIIIIREHAYLHQKPRRGDLIVFLSTQALTRLERESQTTEEEVIFPRRNSTIGSLIGFPEEEIMVENHMIFVNGEALSKELYHFNLPEIPEGYRMTVPSDSYLALGRFFRPGGEMETGSDFAVIPEDSIMGKVDREIKPFFRSRTR